MSDLLARIALRIWAREMKKAQAGVSAKENSPLSVSFGAVLRYQQNANLISRIYQLSGNGTLPISGGKFELGKRGKQGDED